MKQYIGDGVYAEWDGYQIALSVETEGQKHTIYLEPHVIATLNLFWAQCKNLNIAEDANESPG